MEYADILGQMDIFYDLSPTQLKMIAAICHERNLKAGEFIFKENTPGDELFAIVRGEIEILVDPTLVGGPMQPRKGMGPVTITTFRDGQTFGEISLVDQGLRSASARCAADNTKLIVFPRQKLIALCESYTDLGYRLMRNIAADLAFKIRSSDMAIREQLLWRPRQAI